MKLTNVVFVVVLLVLAVFGMAALVGCDAVHASSKPTAVVQKAHVSAPEVQPLDHAMDLVTDETHSTVPVKTSSPHEVQPYVTHAIVTGSKVHPPQKVDPKVFQLK